MMLPELMKKEVGIMDEIKKQHVTLRKRGQITIPKEIIEKLNLREGDTLELRLEDGKVVIVPTIPIAKDQAWFWNKEWQREELEVEKQLREGRISKPMNIDEALKHLNQLKESGNE